MNRRLSCSGRGVGQRGSGFVALFGALVSMEVAASWKGGLSISGV